MVQDIESLANFIANNRKSVLFLDTCAILDIVRFLNRNKADELVAANKLFRKIDADPSLCQFIISSVVPKEYCDNLESCKDDLTKFNKSLSTLVEQYNVATEIINTNNRQFIFELDSLVSHIQNLADKFLSRAIVIKDDDKFHMAASRRVVSNKPPASKGRQELKDCILVEEYLELCKFLRVENSRLPLLFLSSNSKDFCDAETRRLKKELAEEFETNGLKYCYSWAHVLNTIANPVI